VPGREKTGIVRSRGEKSPGGGGVRKKQGKKDDVERLQELGQHCSEGGENSTGGFFKKKDLSPMLMSSVKKEWLRGGFFAGL